MNDDHFDVLDTDTDIGRWCARCTVTRLSDCSILCFADRKKLRHSTDRPQPAHTLESRQ